ncbi:hypothetical protein ACFUO0_20065 [Streptomyces cinereoruber]|uniref:hypothetical protein n=1 Tax=Streptomyces TaxID=1883 RepID=UPI00362E483B
MRIRMRVTLSGTYNGAPWPPRGEALDVPADEAEQLIRYGAAELVEDTPEEPAAAEPKTTRKRPA